MILLLGRACNRFVLFVGEKFCNICAAAVGLIAHHTAPIPDDYYYPWPDTKTVDSEDNKVEFIEYLHYVLEVSPVKIEDAFGERKAVLSGIAHPKNPVWGKKEFGCFVDDYGYLNDKQYKLEILKEITVQLGKYYG